jgi:hypothetical protein
MIAPAEVGNSVGAAVPMLGPESPASALRQCRITQADYAAFVQCLSRHSFDPPFA